MQFYLSGINPLFWKQVESQSRGVYNLSSQQSTSAAIDQVFVAFVQRPIGTLVDIYLAADNGSFAQVAQAKIVDESGFLYARFKIPYTNNLDNIEVMLKENGTNAILANEGFSTSHIDFMFEVQAQAALDAYNRSQQLEEDTSIAKVDDALLYGKYGIYTGLNRRTNQTAGEYRAQTSCLWNAFQYAGTEKGVADAIACVVGPYDSSTISATRNATSNRIFVQPQMGPTANYPAFYTDVSVPVPLIPYDVDGSPTVHPHHYVPATTGEFYVDGDKIPTMQTLGPLPAGSATGFNATNVKTIILHSPNAVANEVTAELSVSSALNVPEQAAISVVLNESNHRLAGTYEDHLANTMIATEVVVVSCYLSPTGTIVVNPLLLPKEGVDFSVAHETGVITWAPSGIVPADGTVYVVDYSYRLDDAIRVVVKKVKPAHKKVVITFSNTVTTLPRSLEA